MDWRWNEKPIKNILWFDLIETIQFMFLIKLSFLTIKYV